MHYFVAVAAKQKIISLISASLKQGSLTLLVLLYSAAAFKIDSLHGLFHADELERLHSPEQEENPCHRSVYHEAKDCEHPTHLTENTKCHLCEFNFAPDQWAPQAEALRIPDVVGSPVANLFPGLIASFQLPANGRAPPLV